MKIEIWADFTCPFCYLGKRNLELAITRFEHRECITIEYKSFELDPAADCTGAESKRLMLMRKYGHSAQKVQEMLQQIILQGKETGIEIKFEKAVHTNTFHAHRLVKYAAKNGRASVLIERLFESYFARNENIGNRDVLISLAREVYLDETETDALLCLNTHAKTVRNDEQLAQELGITSVPFFIFNETYAVSGAQPPEVFKDILEEIWEEEKDEGNKEACESSYCVGDECHSES